jgi:hypothetical protein
MNPSKTYQVDPEVIVTELQEGDAVLLHLETRMYYSLNATGLKIWRLLERGQTSADAAIALTAEYEVDLEHARRSVESTVAMLVTEKLLSV